MFLHAVLGQEDPVLQVRQGGTEVLGLVSRPLVVEPVALRYAVSDVHTGREHG